MSSALAIASRRAEREAISRDQAEALFSKLKFRQGEIKLHDGFATLRVPEGFRFLNGTDAQTVLVKLWGNPPHSADPLGMLMPDGVSSLEKESWAVIVTYEPDDYVSDKDAEKINCTDLLNQMQKEVVSANEERQKAGYELVHLIGWAKNRAMTSSPTNYTGLKS